MFISYILFVLCFCLVIFFLVSLSKFIGVLQQTGELEIYLTSIFSPVSHYTLINVRNQYNDYRFQFYDEFELLVERI